MISDWGAHALLLKMFPLPVQAPSTPAPAASPVVQDPLSASTIRRIEYGGGSLPDPAAPRPRYPDPILSPGLQHLLGNLLPPARPDPAHPSSVDSTGTLTPQISNARDPIEGGDQNELRKKKAVAITNLATRYRSSGAQLPTRPSDASGALTGPRVNGGKVIGGVVTLAPPVEGGGMKIGNDSTLPTDTITERAPVLLTPEPDVYQPNGGEPQPRIAVAARAGALALPKPAADDAMSRNLLGVGVAVLLAWMFTHHAA